MEQRRTRVIILSPDPVHPGGVTRAVETWFKGGLAESVDVQQIYVAGWDAPLFIQILQTARAFIILTVALVRPGTRPGVLHVHLSTGGSVYRDWIALRLARIFHVAIVAHLHSGNFDNWVVAKRTRTWFARNLFQCSTAVVVPVQHWVDVVRGLGAVDVHVLPHGLDERLASELAAASHCAKSTQPSDRIVVLSYGRWAPVKGLDILGEAVRGLNADYQSRLSLRVFGNGDRRWLEHCLRDLSGADVYIGGWLTDREKVSELSKTQAFVAPSRTELFGQALLEAMAAGKPVIATKVGGVPEVLDGYLDARLIDPESPKALQSVLEDLLDGVWPDRQRGEPSSLSARFSARNVAVKLAKIYQAADKSSAGSGFTG